jgi:hypothetical protein
MTEEKNEETKQERRRASSTIVRNSSEESPSGHHRHLKLYCSKAHAGARQPACLVKDTATIMRQKGQAAGRALLFPIQLRHEGRPAYPIKREEPSAINIRRKRGNLKEWKSGDVPREQDC